MKKLLLSMVIAGAALTASAQDPVKYTIKAGATFPTYSTPDVEENGVLSNRLFYAGITADVPVGGVVSIQAGLTFVGKGAKFGASGTEEGKTFRGTMKQNLMYLEIPINAVLNIPVGAHKIFLGAGPYFGMAVIGKNKLTGTLTSGGLEENFSESEDVDFDNENKRPDYGINTLGGFQLSNGFNIHAGYGFGLANIIRSNEGELNHRVFSAGVGYSF
jgi:hypothetical protein